MDVGYGNSRGQADCHEIVLAIFQFPTIVNSKKINKRKDFNPRHVSKDKQTVLVIVINVSQIFIYTYSYNFYYVFLKSGSESYSNIQVVLT